MTWLGFRCWQTTPGPGVYCAVPIRMQQNRANRALNVSKYLPASIYAVGDIRIQIKSQFYCWTNSRPSNDGLWQPMDQSAKSQIHLFSKNVASLKIYFEISFEIFKIRLVTSQKLDFYGVWKIAIVWSHSTKNAVELLYLWWDYFSENWFVLNFWTTFSASLLLSSQIMCLTKCW